MSELKEQLIKELSDSVVDMDEEKTEELSKKYLEKGFDAFDGITKGLAEGMNRAGVLYEEGEYFIPELLVCSDAMYVGLDVLKPHLKYEDSDNKFKAVVGVVEGDTHDIGKNLFKIMLETQGFEVYDLGRDVPPVEFIKKAKEVNADVIGLSTLMTTTMDNMKVVVDMLKEEGMKETTMVMVGGGPISQSFADKIGADGYAPEASKSARIAKELVTNLKG
ncbi:corrinoid protein of di/trimethylamine methyltransferase [Methanococcus maripaludis]|uniref:Corrinoid protein of di/trimethylamine methyltransferase n=1 Tax=Methanococcus maripaludis TaxID=39152 RepID=A0A7J9P359_METMI|nr:corrinoid protein [Methanococcus maripaludis]MBA2853885.1 corrinoid protein of di/trimethylamine methyltransferase [Methanococcus maripaludis]MBA2860109.1 corrinoid protein of di/trimethylamine methyltransferase [Methanococcus maripaludis]MBB6402560.1 corrinoid protein of di/trimethylamine methyltransferase [Methanococcus maripaludis]